MIKVLKLRLILVTVLSGLALAAIFTILVLRLRTGLEREINDKMISRAAGILQPVVQRQMERERDLQPEQPVSAQLVSALLSNARQEGVLAMAIFDGNGATLEAVPATQSFVELPFDDFVTLGNGGKISRFTWNFPIGKLSQGTESGMTTPVLEVVLPVTQKASPSPVGFVRYHLDARALADDLSAIENRIQDQTNATLGLGLLSIAVIVTGASYGLERARRTVEERNTRLLRAEVELDLAARTSAMGQVTSHLMHGIQGAVSGLRLAVTSGQAPDWESVSDYTARLQSMTQEALAVLGDMRNRTSFSVSGEELVHSIRERCASSASERQIKLDTVTAFYGVIDSHRGSILCLIADNLIQNAIQASQPQTIVTASLTLEKDHVVLRVCDQGGGVPENLKERLFQPGITSRPGGTGLGLALSRLLARQIKGDLSLIETGISGSCFELRIPV